jgi:hypothetical protein
VTVPEHSVPDPVPPGLAPPGPPAPPVRRGEGFGCLLWTAGIGFLAVAGLAVFVVFWLQRSIAPPPKVGDCLQANAGQVGEVNSFYPEPVKCDSAAAAYKVDGIVKNVSADAVHDPSTCAPWQGQIDRAIWFGDQYGKAGNIYCVETVAH